MVYKRELNVPNMALVIGHPATVRRENKMRLLEYMDQYFQLKIQCSMQMANDSLSSINSEWFFFSILFSCCFVEQYKWILCDQLLGNVLSTSLMYLLLWMI